MPELGLGPLRQISQSVAELDRAVAFYRDVLGLRLVARLGELAFFDMGGVRLYLAAGGEEAGGSVLYFAVADIHAARAELGERGVAFESEPHVIFLDADGTFGPAGEEERMAFFRDSEGNLLALSSRELPGGQRSSG
jgi:methylmalonyl-CoA/ethylmalonyl-CoA epimerase